jgi:hypothetical protein
MYINSHRSVPPCREYGASSVYRDSERNAIEARKSGGIMREIPSHPHGAPMEQPAMPQRTESSRVVDMTDPEQDLELLATAPPDPSRPAEDIVSIAFTLPVLTSGTWIDDLPFSREDLYGDDERC